MAAAKTLYLTNTVTNNFQQLSETSPGADATTSPNVGWTVGTSATNAFPLDSGTEANTTAATPTDGTIDSTLGDCFRFGPFSGSFASANWTFNFVLIAVTSATGQAGHIRFRLHRSPNSNGSGATQVLAEQTASTVTVSATQANSSLAVNPGALTLDNEYLFIEVGWKCSTGASMSTADVIFRIGSTATRIVTSNFNYTVQKNEAITVTESLRVGLNLGKRVNESSTVADAVTAGLSKPFNFRRKRRRKRYRVGVIL